jgi:hypothetical protein
MNAIIDKANDIFHWASSGSKLTYAAIGTGLLVGLILFKMFFKSIAGLFHSIGFSFGAGNDPSVAAEPGISSSARMKLILILLLPAAFGFAAYMFLPTFFPTVFK